jgi:transcriptional regulator with XRE-family HTH domain
MTNNEKKDYLQVFGSYVKYLRTKKGWSQEELATRCGYTSDTRKSTINKIEAGKSDLPASKIRTLATVFGIAPSDLIDPPTEERDAMLVCELFERCHGKEAFEMVSDFLLLDPEDRRYIHGVITGILRNKKDTASSEGSGIA